MIEQQQSCAKVSTFLHSLPRVLSFLHGPLLKPLQRKERKLVLLFDGNLEKNQQLAGKTFKTSQLETINSLKNQKPIFSRGLQSNNHFYKLDINTEDHRDNSTKQKFTKDGGLASSVFSAFSMTSFKALLHEFLVTARHKNQMRNSKPCIPASKLRGKQDRRMCKLLTSKKCARSEKKKTYRHYLPKFSNV